MSELPQGWAQRTLSDLIAADGLFKDGDWVETKDQDATGAVRLTQLADVGDGFFRDRSRRYLREDQAERLSCTYLAAGDVLVARMPDPLGRACLFPASAHAAVTAVDVCIVRPGEQSVDANWLMWTINAPQFRRQVDALQTGTTRKRISRKNLASIPLPVPPLAEQRRIVAAIEEQFSRLDATAGDLRKSLATLRQLRASLLARAFASSWPLRPIGDVARVGSGATPLRSRQDYYDGGTIPWVTSGQLNDPYVSKPTAFVTEKALQETALKLWPRDTLLVAMYGEGRTRGRCSELLIEAATNQACAAIVVESDSEVDRRYLKLFFLARYDAHRLLSAGGVQPNLSLGLIKRMEFPCPPLADQRRIVAELEQQLSLIDALRAAVESAQKRSAALRRAILERAFRGELVPQDPNDEPASVLLERIRAERDAAPPARQARTARAGR